MLLLQILLAKILLAEILLAEILAPAVRAICGISGMLWLQCLGRDLLFDDARNSLNPETFDDGELYVSLLRNFIQMTTTTAGGGLQGNVGGLGVSVELRRKILCSQHNND